MERDSMSRYIINNVIAVITHTLLALIIWRLPYVFGQVIPAIVNNEYLIAVICTIVYIICGFFLKPVERFSFLSVLFVIIALIGVGIFLAVNVNGDATFYNYFYFNPVAMPSLDLPAIFASVLILLSPAIPSLLMYLGILIRKLIGR